MSQAIDIYLWIGFGVFIAHIYDLFLFGFNPRVIIGLLFKSLIWPPFLAWDAICGILEYDDDVAKGVKFYFEDKDDEG